MKDENENDRVQLPDAQSETPTTGSARGRFVKGTSGNPSGRPKQIRDVEMVRDLARTHTTRAIRTLAEIADDKKCSAAARVAASTALLERGWGKTPGGELEASGGLVIQILKYADQTSEMKVISGEVIDTNKQ